MDSVRAGDTTSDKIQMHPYYGLVTCPLNKTQLTSLGSAKNRFSMKPFCTSNMELQSFDDKDCSVSR